MGIANAAVLPDPVTAKPIISFPSRACGMASDWIGVGLVNFICWIASSKSGTRFSSANVLNLSSASGSIVVSVVAATEELAVLSPSEDSFDSCNCFCLSNACFLIFSASFFVASDDLLFLWIPFEDIVSRYE